MGKTLIMFPLIFVVSLLMMINGTLALPSFKSILIFGDSFLDTGNNNYIPTIARANFPPYGQDFPNHVATGRFSNGLLMSDMLASALGIKDLVPPFLNPNLPDAELTKGVCFASAASGYDNLTMALAGAIPVSKQLEYFEKYLEKLKVVVGEDEANGIVNGSLTVIFSGSNDMILSPRRLQLGPEAFGDFILDRVQDFIKAAYAKGIRNILVAGIPMDTMGYNQKLVNLLSRLQASLPGTKLVYADLQYAFSSSYLTAHANGITELQVPCCPLCIPAGGIACPNPDNFFRWDVIHPTQAAYKIIIKYLIDNSIPKFA
ncbi:GDSL esterase/lipase At1g06990-like [Impatiens glandulifera]|uniref:GDSL esterase/lipase At1g06990-like n=1 Tax=Impatiens glandulifera TaxID=253017 RepID=UPI001FB101F8|nr:GDSL esterase/lipase At1g06990-like [Impatiens glandulifera]